MEYVSQLCFRGCGTDRTNVTKPAARATSLTAVEFQNRSHLTCETNDVHSEERRRLGAS